jgi:hypothetical protein
MEVSKRSPDERSEIREWRALILVMAGLVPAIHVSKNVDARHKGRA